MFCSRCSQVAVLCPIYLKVAIAPTLLSKIKNCYIMSKPEIAIYSLVLAQIATVKPNEKMTMSTVEVMVNRMKKWIKIQHAAALGLQLGLATFPALLRPVPAVEDAGPRSRHGSTASNHAAVASEVPAASTQRPAASLAAAAGHAVGLENRVRVLVDLGTTDQPDHQLLNESICAIPSF
jgi:hypothetical protein